MILIISFPENSHVDRVTAHLSRPWRLVSTDWFPSRLALAMRAGGERRLALRLPDGEWIDLETVGAAWYRRKLSFKVVCGALVAFAGTALVCLR